MRSQVIMKQFQVLPVILIVLLVLTQEIICRRGRGKGRGQKGGMSRVPIGGKWRDPETQGYYNNPEGAKITKASHFDLEYVLGHKINFLCEAKGKPLPHITWFKDGIELYAHNFLQIHEWIYAEKIKSKMEIDPATQMDAGIYDCYADNKFAIDKRTFRTDFVTVFD